MRNETDERIKQALLERTEEIVEIKDSLWKNIDKALDCGVSMRYDSYRKSKTRNSWINTLPKTAAAAVILIFLAVETTPGIAAVNKVKSILVPKKKVVQQLEGQDYQQEVNLVESKSGYTIYMDETIFQVEHLSDRDKITPKNKSTESGLPEVYMEIQQLSGAKPEEAYSKLKGELKSSYKTVNDTGKVTSPLEAFRISASTGPKWNDKLVAYYIVDNRKGGSFVIKEQLFNEAEEGFGARFDNALKEFRIQE